MPGLTVAAIAVVCGDIRMSQAVRYVIAISRADNRREEPSSPCLVGAPQPVAVTVTVLAMSGTALFYGDGLSRRRSPCRA